MTMPRRPPSFLLDFLAPRKFWNSQELTQGLRKHHWKHWKQQKGQRRRQRNDDEIKAIIWKGVHRGNYVRVKVPPKASTASFSASMLLLPSVMTFPPVFPSNLRAKAAAVLDAATHPSDWQFWYMKFRAWWSQNWGTVAMNLGSVCTLVGFTCTDILDLRTYSMCGSIGAVLYNLQQSPVRLPPILWSSTFATVNAVKIYQIRQERGAAVHLTAEEEETYNRFFLPHGVTPKQFETIFHKATTMFVAKEECIIKKDDKLDHVYLIVDGTTKANIRGRHLTAASFSPQAHERKQGGASGAWVGEMAFLEQYWIKEQAKRQQQQQQTTTSAEERVVKADTTATPVAAAEQEQSDALTKRSETKSVSTAVTLQDGSKPVDPTAKQRVEPGKGPPPVAKAPHALYTIVAKDDCRVLRWSHEEMEELLGKSTDLRSSMTRAMTQAIVGKVINFTVSKAAGIPTWSAWLDDWKYSAASDIKVEAVPPGQTRLGLPEDGSLEQAVDVPRGIATKHTVPELL